MRERDDADMTPPVAPVSSPNGKREPGSLIPVTARGEATRQRILESAEQVFGEMGYYEASVSEITRRAGVAQGTFYLYFHSKREIFVELIDDLGTRLRSATSAAIADTTDRLIIERQGFAAFFAFLSHHPRIYKIVQEADRVAPEAARAYYQRISEGYQRGLRRAREFGTIREVDPEATAYALMGVAHFVALRWLVWPQELGAEEHSIPPAVFDAVMEFISHGLVGR